MTGRVLPRRHRIRRLTDEGGYGGSCGCGWRTHRRTRELRDRDADAHQLTDPGRHH
jgi:hypothetical protein